MSIDLGKKKSFGQRNSRVVVEISKAIFMGNRWPRMNNATNVGIFFRGYPNDLLPYKVLSKTEYAMTTREDYRCRAI